MISTFKVATSFSRYSDSELEQKAQHVLTNLTNNASYASPTPALADVQAALTAFTTALANQPNQGKQGTIVKNQKRELLEDMLAQLALYVQFLHAHSHK